MSFNYIANLGITRLKEIGKILRIPRYTTYKDPEALRQYIQEYLDENGSVKPEHLRKINMSKKRVSRLTSHILEIANRKMGLPRGVYPSIMIHKENCDAQMAEKLAELAKCQEQAGNCLLDDETREALKNYIGTTSSFNLKSLINRILEKESTLHKTASTAIQDLNKCKEEAVQALEAGQRAQEALQAKIAQLTAKAEELESTINPNRIRELEGQIITLSEEATTLRLKVQENTEKASTLETVVAELRVQLGESVDKATRFEKELEVLRRSSAESLNKCRELHASAIERASQCEREKESISEELQQCRANLHMTPQIINNSSAIEATTDHELVKKLETSAEKIVTVEAQLKECRGLLQGDNKKLEGREAELASQLERATAEFEKLSQELLQSKEREVTCADRSARALEDLASVTEREKALQAKLGQIEGANAKCVTALQEATSKAEMASGKLQRGREAVIANLHEVNKQYEKCMETGRRLKTAYDEIDASYKSEQEKCSALAVRLKSTEIELRHSIGLRDEKIAKVESALEKCMHTGRRLKKEYDALKGRADIDLEACEADRKARGKKIKGAYEKLKDVEPLKKQVEQLARENNELQARVAYLGSENRQLKADLEVKKTWGGAVTNLVWK